MAKGVCIILVVIGHCYVDTTMIPGMEIVRMPLYFILSGLFFKTYGGLGGFILKKVNKILIPFLFFFACGFFADNISHILNLTADSCSITDFLIDEEMFNKPLWFLLSLFCANVIFATICSYVVSEKLRILIIFILASIGCLLGVNNIGLPLWLDSTLSALPFFCFGYYLKKTPLLIENKYDKYNIMIVVVLYIISLVLSKVLGCALDLSYNDISNPIVVYCLGVTSSLALLMLCKMIKRLPVISYIGRYSIITLCVHWLILRFLIILPFGLYAKPLVLTIITMLCSLLAIPICKRIIPWFVAQKDLISMGSTK